MARVIGTAHVILSASSVLLDDGGSIGGDEQQRRWACSPSHLTHHANTEHGDVHARVIWFLFVFQIKKWKNTYKTVASVARMTTTKTTWDCDGGRLCSCKSQCVYWRRRSEKKV